MSTTNQPALRANHVGVVVGTRYIIFGGASPIAGPALASGGQYDLEADEWSAISDLNDARTSHVGVSTGTGILTFGGLTNQSSGATEGPALEEFTPNSGAGQWARLSPSNTPTLRYGFSGIWTGTGFFIVGGGTNSIPNAADGAIYTPGAGWVDYPSSLPQAGWTGTVLFMQGSTIDVAWGGYPNYESGAGASFTMGQWSNWTEPADPLANASAFYAWDGATRVFFLASSNPNKGAPITPPDIALHVLDIPTSQWLPDDPAPVPSGFCASAPHALAWSGTEMVVWGGQCSTDNSTVGTATVGGRYQPPAP